MIDALSHLGVRHIDMPCSSQRVWAAIQAARHGQASHRPLWRHPPAVFDRLPAAATTSAPEGPDI